MQLNFAATHNLKQLISSSLAICLIGLTILVTSCDKKETDPIIERGTVVDSDGNEYPTVKIGGHWWMVANLRVTTFRNGEPIPELASSEDWTSGDPGYSKHPDASVEMGLIYNGYAVADSRGIAPEGWHVATDEDWKRLEQHLGMETSAVEKNGWRGSSEGDALKATGTNNWVRFDPVWPTNSSGFNALAGSCRIFDSRYGSPGTLFTGFWWTKTASTADPDKFVYRYLDYKHSQIFRQSVVKSYGFSVRCVKNQ
jgi:uncharacterized protein (TIGR02145 family)